jgi:hypothetical protein
VRSPGREVSPMRLRAPLSEAVVGSSQCSSCGAEVGPERKGVCCPARVGTAQHRRRQNEAREARDRETRALLEAALRKLEEGSS